MIVGQLAKFAGVGVVATGTQYVILIAMMELGYTDAVSASATGYVISAILNYLLNYHITFNSKERHTRAVPRFAIVVMSGLVLNSLAMYVMTYESSAHYLVSQIAATLLVLVWNFIVNRHWTYKAAQSRSELE